MTGVGFVFIKELANTRVQLAPCPGCGRCCTVRFGVVESHIDYRDRNGKHCPLMSSKSEGRKKK